MNITGMNLGVKIKKLRELKNYTQIHMANELGISQSTYSKIEMGEVDVSMSKLEKISSILGLSPEEVFAFSEQMIFNVMYNQNGHNGFVINKGLSETEVELYKDQISTLKSEIEHLKKVIESLLK
jgi:transcriptional regulator with XRE-family HTH domain